MRPRFRVDLTPAAQRQLRRLPPGARELQGTDYRRLRVGDLRVVYWIDEATSVVVVLAVARRSESSYRRVR